MKNKLFYGNVTVVVCVLLINICLVFVCGLSVLVRFVRLSCEYMRLCDSINEVAAMKHVQCMCQTIKFK